MPITEKFLAARRAERRFRQLVHVRGICWVRLHNAAGVFAHAPLLPLTERHRLELVLVRCAFFVGWRPSGADVLLFLWRLHPLYRAPQFGREGWLSAGVPRPLGLLARWRAFGSWRAAWAHARLADYVRCCDVPRASAAIVAFIAQAFQDEPGAETDPLRPRRGHSEAAPDRCMTDNYVDYLMSVYRLSPDQALDLPIALHYQLYRERALAQPDGELEVFAPSDALLSG
jgi:hypothetical protein